MGLHPRRNEQPAGQSFGTTGAVSARFGDAEEARGAVERLQRKGIEAADISIEGKAIQRAARARDARGRETKSVRHVGLRVGFGGIAGTIGGVMLGAVLELVLYGTQTDGHLWAFLIGGALAGGVIGGTLAAARTLALTEDFELTFAPEAGEVIVSVHSDQRPELDLAEEVLKDRLALDVRRTDPPQRRHA